MPDKDSRLVRKRILKILYQEHPRWVEDEFLRILLDDQGCAIPHETMRSELVYLRDYPNKGRGYVELQARHVPGSDETIYESRLTPLGVNLVEKYIPPDPMIAEF